jgi:hypothetical protein
MISNFGITIVFAVVFDLIGAIVMDRVQIRFDLRHRAPAPARPVTGRNAGRLDGGAAFADLPGSA